MLRAVKVPRKIHESSRTLLGCDVLRAADVQERQFQRLYFESSVELCY